MRRRASRMVVGFPDRRKPVRNRMAGRIGRFEMEVHTRDQETGVSPRRPSGSLPGWTAWIGRMAAVREWGTGGSAVVFTLKDPVIL